MTSFSAGNCRFRSPSVQEWTLNLAENSIRQVKKQIFSYLFLCWLYFNLLSLGYDWIFVTNMCRVQRLGRRGRLYFYLSDERLLELRWSRVPKPAKCFNPGKRPKLKKKLQLYIQTLHIDFKAFSATRLRLVSHHWTWTDACSGYLPRTKSPWQDSWIKFILKPKNI